MDRTHVDQDARIEVPWSHTPPDNPRPNYSILRCKGGGVGRLGILSDRVEGVELHFWHGRSVPCLARAGFACDPCNDPAGNLARWRGYLAVFQFATQRKFILEVTPPCMDSIEQYRKDHGTLRGALIELQRSGGRTNGRITAALVRSETPPERCPAAFDVREQLERIWEVHKLRPRTIEALRIAQEPSENGNGRLRGVV